MARELGADSLRYLPIESIARAVDRPADELCRACITGRYPTPHGQKLYQIALANAEVGARQRTHRAAGRCGRTKRRAGCKSPISVPRSSVDGSSLAA